MFTEMMMSAGGGGSANSKIQIITPSSTTASSTMSGGNPTNVNAINTTSMWGANQQTEPKGTWAKLNFDLGAVYDIDHVDIVCGSAAAGTTTFSLKVISTDSAYSSAYNTSQLDDITVNKTWNAATQGASVECDFSTRYLQLQFNTSVSPSIYNVIVDYVIIWTKM